MARPKRTSLLLSVLLATLLMPVAGGLSPAQQAQAQSSGEPLGEALRRVSAESYSERYVAPLVESAGAALSSGLFTRAPVNAGLAEGVDIYLGVRAFAARGGARSFSGTLTGTRRVRHEGKIYTADVTYRATDAPTALGAGGGESGQPMVEGTATFTDESGEQVAKDVSFEAPPGLLGESGFVATSLPAAALQGGIGVRAIGTQVSARYVPPGFLPDRATSRVGKARLVGGGLRHTISRWIPAIPFGLAAHGYYQRVSASEGDEDSGGEEYARMEVWTTGLTVSKTLSAFTFFGGVGASRATGSFGYVPDRSGEPAAVPVSFEAGGDWHPRGRAGVELDAGPLAISLEYDYAGQPVFAAGFGIGL